MRWLYPKSTIQFERISIILSLRFLPATFLIKRSSRLISYRFPFGCQSQSFLLLPSQHVYLGVQIGPQYAVVSPYLFEFEQQLFRITGKEGWNPLNHYCSCRDGILIEIVVPHFDKLEKERKVEGREEEVYGSMIFYILCCKYSIVDRNTIYNTYRLQEFIEISIRTNREEYGTKQMSPHCIRTQWNEWMNESMNE